MNITLSVDEQTVEKARETARNQGTSLNELIRRFLEQLAGIRPTGKEVAAMLRRISAEARAQGASTAEPFIWNREDCYDPKRIGKK
jgi:hypothetical protein